MLHTSISTRAPAGNGPGWTDTRIERLKQLWADGRSASDIAALLGGVTRNAVIGKVHRLGLPGRTTPASPPPLPPIDRDAPSCACRPHALYGPPPR